MATENMEHDEFRSLEQVLADHLQEASSAYAQTNEDVRQATELCEKALEDKTETLKRRAKAQASLEEALAAVKTFAASKFNDATQQDSAAVPATVTEPVVDSAAKVRHGRGASSDSPLTRRRTRSSPKGAPRQERILRLLATATESMKVGGIAKAIEDKYANVYQTLQVMHGYLNVEQDEKKRWSLTEQGRKKFEELNAD